MLCTCCMYIVNLKARNKKLQSKVDVKTLKLFFSKQCNWQLSPFSTDPFNCNMCQCCLFYHTSHGNLQRGVLKRRVHQTSSSEHYGMSKQGWIDSGLFLFMVS